jgi:hypothetical protein
MSKEVWVMCCSSESGDHYNCAETWDHEPSQEEIDRVRIGLDASEYDEDCDGDWDEDSEFCVTVDGKRYSCYISDWTISKIVV